MIISTATLALLRGDATPELADAPGRVVKPMGEIERPKEYKQREPRKPVPVALQPADRELTKAEAAAQRKRDYAKAYYFRNRERVLAQQKAHKVGKKAATAAVSQPAEPEPAEPMPGVDMDAIHLVSAEKIAVEDGYSINDFCSSLLERDSVLRNGLVGVPIAGPEPEPVGPSVKELIADGLLVEPEHQTIEFTNLDVQRAFDLTESEAFNFTQALVERGFLTRDLKQDADGRLFFSFSTRRRDEPHHTNSINP